MFIKLTLAAITLLIPSICRATVYSKILDKSVVLHAYVMDKGRKGRVICSGTYIDKDTVLTAAHCVDEVLPGKSWIKTHEGESLPVKIERFSTPMDLAILHVYGPDHSYAVLGNFPKVGDSVECAGTPLGLDFLVSQGIVAAVNRVFPPFFAVYLIHTAMINSGSSGGGVFNTAGQLVGVNTMASGEFGWTGISIAVDVHTIEAFLYGR